ncbi:hypothetical protein QTN25_003971 [Entamoeba marina]
MNSYEHTMIPIIRPTPYYIVSINSLNLYVCRSKQDNDDCHLPPRSFQPLHYMEMKEKEVVMESESGSSDE